MISRVELKNFGPLAQFEWNELSKINLVIGDNGSGKTFLLKILYSTLRALEDYRRGEDKRLASEILAEKLYWTFQPDKIGDLVTKGSYSPLSCRLAVNEKDFYYSYGKDTKKKITTLENHVPRQESNSIFLPAKEVLSLYHIILKSREQDKVFGFDDTYLDLARALRTPCMRGRNFPEFADARMRLKNVFGGRVEYQEKSDRWQFKKGKEKFPVGVTAEGIKKISILDRLLGNRYLNKGSVVFVDEPEAALHPVTISMFLDIVSSLAQCGIQFFLASHSYFVVKKLFLISKKLQIPVKVASEKEKQWTFSDLDEQLPRNPIVEESVRLYREEVELTLDWQDRKE